MQPDRPKQPDRHRHNPISLRFPEGLSAWLKEHSKATGIPVRQIVLRAVTEYRERQERNNARHPDGR